MVNDTVGQTVVGEDVLAEIDGQVIRLFAMVSHGLAAVTAAFLGCDRCRDVASCHGCLHRS